MNVIHPSIVKVRKWHFYVRNVPINFMDTLYVSMISAMEFAINVDVRENDKKSQKLNY